ncbi:hypothetical protein [Butyrivibrio sp. XPD2002]|uniref:hypothetical protein n=1 Tax=Butyrivibrio sp. XPD2002 TaxID=1280665 RepID=UPI0012DE4E53|nr:hypothetical protein [Butyrivibrio sp. XPD2002]
MNTISATRDSVCMGDDCDAPHFESFSYGREEMLSEFLTKLYGYVACVGGRTIRWFVVYAEALVSILGLILQS